VPIGSDCGAIEAFLRNSPHEILARLTLVATPPILPEVPLNFLSSARVVGVLVVKQRTVPDTYPPSSAALTAGCNQKTARDAVMNVAAVSGVACEAWLHRRLRHGTQCRATTAHRSSGRLWDASAVSKPSRGAWSSCCQAFHSPKQIGEGKLALEVQRQPAIRFRFSVTGDCAP